MSATPTNKDGFPLEPCSRCQGTGHYLYNSVDGTVCYGCRGTKYAIAPHARKAYQAFVKAREEALVRPASDVRVGDRIYCHTLKGLAISTVLSIEPDDSNDGYIRFICKRGGMSTHSDWSVHVVEPFDPAPFLAMIPKESK